MRRTGFDHGPFNAVASCEQGFAKEALRNLAAVGEFRATPYPSVLIGRVEGDVARQVAAQWARDPDVFGRVVRISPLDHVVRFERDDVTEVLCCELEGRVTRASNCTFYVRARLRGLKGRLETQAVERALGAFLLDATERIGRPARVTFTDPDLVLVIEVVGRRVGFGFVDRETRSTAILCPR